MRHLLTADLAGFKATGQEELYEQWFTGSAERFRSRARKVIAGGTTHDGWMIEPFPLSVECTAGPYKWDCDGHRIIDYWMGHGALLAGHAFTPVVEAITLQASRGTHYGAASLLEVEWAELVCELIPSAELVRFTSSGTEATQLALRVARAYTGRELVLKLDGHFHGWHDEALAHFFPANEAGLNPGCIEQVAIADPFSAESAGEFLAAMDVAAVILEPGGGGSGGLPWSVNFLAELRELTQRYGTLLIFDEVVSGFRYSPGGAQQICGVLPDLTVLAKILSGGLPGGAVCGKKEIMEVFGSGKHIAGRRIKVPHTGTFNGNPLSAAAGIALLSQVANGELQKQAEESAEALVRLINQRADEVGVDVHLYRQSSIFHHLIGAQRAHLPLGPSGAVLTLSAQHAELYATLRRVLLLEGVDTHPIHGWVSAAHQQEVIEATADAYERAFSRLREVKEFGSHERN